MNTGKSNVECLYCKNDIFIMYALYDVKELVKVKLGNDYSTEVLDLEVVGGENVNRLVCEKCMHVFEIHKMNGVEVLVDMFQIEKKDGVEDGN